MVTGSRPLRRWFNAPRPRSFEATVPIVDILLHLVLAMAVALLDLALELLARLPFIAAMSSSVSLAHFSLTFADELLPVTFDTIPIHEILLSVGLQVVTGDGLLWSQSSGSRRPSGDLFKIAARGYRTRPYQQITP